MTTSELIDMLNRSLNSAEDFERTVKKHAWITVALLLANFWFGAFNLADVILTRRWWALAIVPVSVLGGCVALHSCVRDWQHIQLSKQWRRSVVGMGQAILSGNEILFQHWDDQQDAVLRERRRLLGKPAMETATK